MKTKFLVAAAILLAVVLMMIKYVITWGAGVPGSVAMATQGKDHGADEKIVVENRIDVGGKIAKDDANSQMRRDARFKSITYDTDKILTKKSGDQSVRMRRK